MPSTHSTPVSSERIEKSAAEPWRRIGWERALRLIHDVPERLRWQMVREKGADGREHYWLVAPRGTRWQIRLKHGLQIRKT